MEFTIQIYFEEGKSLNDINEKNEMKYSTENALLLGKQKQDSKIQLIICFFLPLTFFCPFSFSFSNEGE